MAKTRAVQPVVHLHTHTEYSVRDGISHIRDLCEAAAEDGQPAIAITDHGHLGGSWQLQQEAERAGIKPIFGCEVYVAIASGGASRNTEKKVDADALETDSDTGHSWERKYHHLTVLAESPVGWRNLLKIQNAAHDNYWSKPIVGWDELGDHSEGLIALTGCLGGPVKSRLAVGDLDGATAAMKKIDDVFDSVYVEVMSHGIPAEDKMMPELVGLAKRYKASIVATNDSHFTHPDGSVVHDAWLCNGTKYTLDSPERWRFTGEGYWLRSAAEMRALFDTSPGTERAVDTTLEIAERCTGERVIPEERLRLPVFDRSANANDLLYEQVKAGARRLYGDDAGRLPEAVRRRLRHEMDVITEKGLADYFLIVADMISWARERGYRVGPGRGSAAGSCVSYCLGIIAVDPLAHGLLFERFLSPTRVGMPDIDTDFEDEAQESVINYLAERWGQDRVARIGAYGTAKARAALQSAGRVIGKADIGIKLANAVPDTTGGNTASLQELTDKSSEVGTGFRELVRDLASTDDDTERLVAIASGFEDTIANETIHPCGVVISDEGLPGVVPLHRDRRTGGLVTDWDGTEMEAAGFLKMDVLGVKNLSIVARAIKFVEESTGEVVDPETATDDPEDPRARAAWDLIAAGKTDGIFQLESSGMTDLAMQITPRSISELAVIIALYRPGPMGKGMHTLYAGRKTGQLKKSYAVFTDDPDEVAVISGVLDETLGIPIYQEQLMSLGEAVAGFGPVERDRLRHAVGKKVREEMDEVGEMFVSGATSNTDMAGEPKQVFSKETAVRLWDAMKSAGDYAFNKSHSVGYAKLSYENAWLKANWPAAFAAAWLAVTETAEKRIHVLASLSKEDVTVKGPDVNASGIETGLDDTGSVRLGLSEIKGIGTNSSAVTAEREATGPFTSLADLIARVKVPVNVVEGLIEAGACDSIAEVVHDTSGKEVSASRRLGMLMVAPVLRDYPTTPVPACEWGVVERSARERDRLGVDISSKPLVVLGHQLSNWRAPDGGHKFPVHKLPSVDSYASVIGILANFTIIRKRSRFARLTISGTRGTVDGVMWSDALAALEKSTEGIPAIGSIVGVDAKVKSQREFRRGDVDSQYSDDADGISEPKKELSVLRIWTGPLDDPVTEQWPQVQLPELQAISDPAH
jgi:DNA polymerase-3 subunit alpha